jgi:hypothetical protein
MPTVEWINSNMPKVLMTPEVQRDQEILCHEAGSDEIGWLGCVKRNQEDNTFLVYKILPLPRQEVHSATTEILPEGLCELMTDLLESGDITPEEANDIRYWGHSHVNMGVTPSGQDSSQMDALTANVKEANSVNRFFIRCITNKKGDYNFAIFQYDLGIALKDANWSLALERSDDRVEYWKAQIEDKVSEIRTTYKKIGYGAQHYNGYKGGGQGNFGNGFEEFDGYGYGGYEYGCYGKKTSDPKTTRKGQYAFNGVGKS